MDEPNLAELVGAWLDLHRSVTPDTSIEDVRKIGPKMTALGVLIEARAPGTLARLLNDEANASRGRNIA